MTSSGLTLIGNAGANRLEGTIQDDVLNGGTGRDTLIGGGGDDVFLVGNSHFAAGEAIQGGEGATTGSTSRPRSSTLDAQRRRHRA